MHSSHGADQQAADTPEAAALGTAPEEASAPALELSPANSGMPLLLSSDAREEEGSEDQTCPFAPSSGSTGRARRTFKQSRQKSEDTSRGLFELGAEAVPGSSRDGAARRKTAEVSSDPRQLVERRRTGNFLFSPFEAHAQTVTSECGPSFSNSSTATGASAQDEGAFSQVTTQRKQNITSQPDKSAYSGWQSLQTSSSSSAEEAASNTAEAVKSSLLEKREKDGLASNGSLQSAQAEGAGNAADASIGAEMEMISLTSGKYHEESEKTHEEQDVSEAHMGSVLAGQTRRPLPCRTPSEASLARPKFNLMVYAGWVPPSLRTSPIGAWTDSRLSDANMGSFELLSADQSGINSLDPCSKPLLPSP